ncbi:hypothetical protein JAAARDRAFT_61594 [Jaapia argillacea MUCL 33604]|uniref:Uncharacterized protein n=1 Tax=Jaapia argillacea MUCL 33604 TaxID=933084 RepID=A0A067PGT4_9AGAM|nr:hypothetical protein JAAARDRAFT_61594 [Jaapia argillacea MUCL 33604]
MESLSRFCERYASRRALARILSTFLCSVIIVCRPFSRLGGPSAFLILTVKELVFSVQGDLAQQLEATVFNILGALFGIGASTLAKYIASRFEANQIYLRTIPALFLVGIVFIAGFLKSSLPRLGLSTRICCFVTIWMLSGYPNPASDILSEAQYYLWITITPAIVSLFSAMLFLRWSSAQLATEVASSFSGLRDCLSMSMDRAFSDSAPQTAGRLQAIHDQLSKKSLTLNATYARAAFELRIGRLGVKSIKPLIGIIEHLRRELSWGMSFYRAGFPQLDDQSDQASSIFRVPALDLGHAILASMKAVQDVTLTCFDSPGSHASALSSEKATLHGVSQKLMFAQQEARSLLQKISDELDMVQRSSLSAELPSQREFFDSCLFMISLLQMANEMRRGLRIAEGICEGYETSRTRLWFPRISYAWLGVSPRTFIMQEETDGIPLEYTVSDASGGMSAAEAKEGLAEQAYSRAHRSFPNINVVPSAGVTRMRMSWRLPFALIYLMWTHSFVIYFRLRLSRLLRSAQHSSHLRHALKYAGGVAILSIPAFLPLGSPGRHWFTSVHGPWMTVSYVWVLETNTGATWRVGYLRISGTVLGAIYAYITWLICRTNPYGLVALVTASDIPITWLVMHTPIPSVGVVMAISIPPVAFSEYMQPSLPVPAWDLALQRGVMIAAGIIAALAVNHFIFPRHCRTLFLSNASRSLSLLCQLYMKLSRRMFRIGSSYANAPDDKHQTLKLESEIRTSLHGLSLFIVAMNDELSLMPKPMRLYRHTVSTMQRLMDLLTGLRKVRENIPHKETVAAVFRERRELVSCICITLFACEHAFRARQPLPQFLPSARHAWKRLAIHVDDRLRRAREEDAEAVGLSLVYAFAESEVLSDMVDTMEELLESTRKLFGTSAWLTHFDQTHYSMDTSQDEEDPHAHGWYSTFRSED